MRVTKAKPRMRFPAMDATTGQGITSSCPRLRTMWHWNKRTRSHEKIRKKTLGKVPESSRREGNRRLSGSLENRRANGLRNVARFGPAVAWTNVHGAGENRRWICEKFAGKVVNIALTPTQRGNRRERWAAALNQFADVRIVELPDGYDVRRFLTEAQQRHLLDGKPPGEAASLAFDELTALAGKAELMPRDARTKEQLGDGGTPAGNCQRKQSFRCLPFETQ